MDSKKLLLLLLLTLIKLAFSGCFTGTTDADDRRLGIHTNADLSWAKSNSGKFYANIYANGGWDGWRRLDNENCDDWQIDAVDYFDDFEDITAEWEAISFYNCENDGLLIETLYYWDGSEEKTMHLWYSSVAGPFNQYCLYTSGVQADIYDPSTVYSEILVDGDSSTGGMCEGITFGTSGYYGTVWQGTSPGPPDCSGNEYGLNLPWYHSIVNTVNDYQERLLNYTIIIIIIALISIISNSCLIAAIIKSKKNKQYKYGKVMDTDAEL